MVENVCVGCQYYENCNHPERFMKCMGYKEKTEGGENMLKVGDTIQCADANDAVNYMTELAKNGIETDFLYKKNGIEGLWLEVIRIGEENA